jgi:phage/plasmid-associated DNA primase
MHAINIDLLLLPFCRLCFDGESWHYWNRRRYVADEKSAFFVKSVLINQLRTVYRRLRGELNAAIKAAADEKKKNALCEKLKRLRTYNNSREISSTLELVRGELFAPDFAQQLDANPDILNVGNGVLLLRTGELDLHRPQYMCSKIAETDFMVRPPLRSTTKTKRPVSWRISQLACSECFSVVWQVLQILSVFSDYHTHRL